MTSRIWIDCSLATTFPYLHDLVSLRKRCRQGLVYWGCAQSAAERCIVIRQDMTMQRGTPSDSCLTRSDANATHLGTCALYRPHGMCHPSRTTIIVDGWTIQACCRTAVEHGLQQRPRRSGLQRPTSSCTQLIRHQGSKAGYLHGTATYRPAATTITHLVIENGRTSVRIQM